MTIVIGLVGEKGSGKGTFAVHLADIAKGKRVASLRFSDLLRETLALWHIPQTRANLQNIAVVMDQGFGAGTLSNATRERIAHIDADIVVVDGVRWDTDAALIRSFPKNLLVYITADVRSRYERTVARSEKEGERETKFEQFIWEEGAANETGIPRIGATADYTIKNEGTMAAFAGAVRDCYMSRIAPLF